MVVITVPRKLFPGEQAPTTPGADIGVLNPNSALGGALAPEPQTDENLPAEAAIADDSDLEAAAVTLASRRRAQEAQSFLDSVAPVEKAPAQPPASPAPAGDDQETEAADQQQQQQQTPPPASPGIVGTVLWDVGRGLTEAPLQVLGGMRDAAQSTIDLAQWLQEQNVAGVKASGYPKLPDIIKSPETVTGGLVHSVAQFLAGFAIGGKILKAAKIGIEGAPIAGAMIKGAWSDFSAFHAQDQKLSDLVQSFPELKNPVTEFLSSHPGDSEAAGRFKRALEGLALGGLTEGLFRAVKFMRDAYVAHQGAVASGIHTPPASGVSAAPAKPPASPLGNADLPLTAKPGDMIELPDLGVPADVAAEGASGAAADQAAIERMAQNNPAAVAFSELKSLTPLGQGEMYINFARIETEADIKRVIQDAGDAFKGKIDDARRGTRTHEQTRAAAYEIDAWNALLNRRAGAPLNAEESFAARNLWEASARKLLEIADATARDPAPDNLFAFRKMLAIHSAIQTEVLAARAETARALDAWKISARGGRQRLDQIQTLLATYGGEETSELLAREVASLKNLPEKWGALADMAERGALARTFGAAKEVYTNALLSNPVTHIKVVESNALMQGLDVVERWAASGFSQKLGSGQIGPGEAAAAFFARTLAVKEAWILAEKAFVSGQSEFGARFMQYADFGFRREIAARNVTLNRGSWLNPLRWPANVAAELRQTVNGKLNTGAWRDRSNWLGNGVDALGAMVNWPGRMVGAQDDFFKMIGYRGEVAARAFRRIEQQIAGGTLTRDEASGALAEMMRNPPADIHQAAIDHARYLNFTAEPGKFVKYINRFERELGEGHLGAQIGAALLRFLLPFRSTPAQITWAALERTPFAPLLGRFKEAMAAGGAARDIALTRMALGTTAMMAALDLALDGYITGGGPRGERNKAERQTLIRSGWQEYSLKLPDGISQKNTDNDGKPLPAYRYFSFNQLDPFGMHLGMAADLAEVINNADHLDHDRQESIFRAATALGLSFIHNILDKTWMSGVTQLMRAFDQAPEGGGHYAEQMISSYVGSGARWLRRALDPNVRYTHDLITELKNHIPGLSEDLPPARDFWGRIRTYQSGMGAIYDATMPVASRRFDPEPIDKEILDNGFNLGMPQMTLSFGKGLNLYLQNHPEFYSRFLEIRGQEKPSDMPGTAVRDPGTLKALKRKEISDRENLIKKYGDVPLLELLNGIVTHQNDDLSPIYDAAAGGRRGGKEEMIKHIVADYTRAAKGALIYENSNLAEKLNRKRAGAGASLKKGE